ncbi:MAG: dihydrolipoyl dehydrogenase, partial [Candidatus Hydrothermarchaeaceae archaeon]
SGVSIVDLALSQGLKAALVDKGPLGGTCLNLGCIPSKMLMYPADVIAEIQGAEKLGIHAEITSIDFNSIMKRMREIVQEGQDHMQTGVENTEDLDFYEGEGHFIGQYTIEVKGEKIKGQKIFIASGARPLIPPVKGIDKIEYLTNENVLKLEKRPESIVIIGGGYIAAEYGHFFASMGTDVTILQRGDKLLPNAEPEISDLLKKEMEKRMNVYTDTEALEVKKKGDGYTVIGKEKEFTAEKIMVAAGRKSNADLLKVESTGVETDERGFIKVNGYLETSKENIWALGDAIGKQMFRHVANREAILAWYNAVNEKKVKMDYLATPHAVFSHPQIASVGLTEEQARKDHDVLVGKAKYSDIAKGKAMMEEDGFAKATIDKNSGRILGFHIIGPHASILVQEVVNAMASEGGIRSIANSMHIHPALSELILTTLGSLEEP